MGNYKGFSQVELRRPGRSTFDLSHENRLSTRMGKLTPIFHTEVMPNDSFRGSSEVLLKLAPMLAPIFHRVNCYVHYFFVPYRLIWEDWETFITGGRLGEAVTSPPVKPKMDVSAVNTSYPEVLELGSLSDYMDMYVPDPDSMIGSYFDLSPFAAWYKIYMDYYRDRNYIDDNDTLPLPSGLQVPNDAYAELMRTRYRAWEHDYFTSALPWTQRGAEVLMPLAGSGTVTYLDTSQVYTNTGAIPGAGGDLGFTGAIPALVNLAGGAGMQLQNIDEVNLISSEVSINDLRRAVRLQEWLERNALAGSRYTESIMAHFGRKSSDARLQRAEYIGGGKAVVQISEVMTTAYSEDAASEIVPPGNMAGRGSTYSNVNSFRYNAEEHGFIFGILSVMPTSGYMQGIRREYFARNTFLDYPWPTFAHLGEQEVWKNEIFVNQANWPTGDPDPETGIFGYQSRYADWKFMSSSAHGDFRTTLDFWHLTRKFSATPALGADFVTFEDSLQNRIFAVEDVDTLWMYVYNNIKVKRSLPYFGTPQL